MALFKVSYTKASLYLRCRYAYWLKYVRKLKRRIKARPLMFGSIIHRLLEAHAEGRSWRRELKRIEGEQGNLFAAEREMYGEILADCALIFQAYLDYWGDDLPDPIEHDGRYSEHWIELKLPGGILLVMKVDGLSEYRGLRMVQENKTGTSIPGEDERWRSVQTATYLSALKLAGLGDFDGVLWEFVMSKAPTRPKLTPKTQKLSTKEIVTLPAVVSEFIEKNDLDPNAPECEKAMERAEESLPRYFDRVVTPFNRKVVGTLWEEFQAVCAEMKRGTDFYPRTIARHCSWCDYEPLCRTALTGGDPEPILEREYVSRAKEKDA